MFSVLLTTSVPISTLITKCSENSQHICKAVGLPTHRPTQIILSAILPSYLCHPPLAHQLITFWMHFTSQLFSNMSAKLSSRHVWYFLPNCVATSDITKILVIFSFRNQWEILVFLAITPILLQKQTVFFSNPLYKFEYYINSNECHKMFYML